MGDVWQHDLYESLQQEGYNPQHPQITNPQHTQITNHQHTQITNPQPLSWATPSGVSGWNSYQPSSSSHNLRPNYSSNSHSFSFPTTGQPFARDFFWRDPTGQIPAVPVRIYFGAPRGPTPYPIGPSHLYNVQQTHIGNGPQTQASSVAFNWLGAENRTVAVQVGSGPDRNLQSAQSFPSQYIQNQVQRNGRLSPPKPKSRSRSRSPSRVRRNRNWRSKSPLLLPSLRNHRSRSPPPSRSPERPGPLFAQRRRSRTPPSSRWRQRKVNPGGVEFLRCQVLNEQRWTVEVDKLPMCAIPMKLVRKVTNCHYDDQRRILHFPATAFESAMHALRDLRHPINLLPPMRGEKELPVPVLSQNNFMNSRSNNLPSETDRAHVNVRDRLGTDPRKLHQETHSHSLVEFIDLTESRESEIEQKCRKESEASRQSQLGAALDSRRDGQGGSRELYNVKANANASAKQLIPTSCNPGMPFPNPIRELANTQSDRPTSFVLIPEIRNSTLKSSVRIPGYEILEHLISPHQFAKPRSGYGTSCMRFVVNLSQYRILELYKPQTYQMVLLRFVVTKADGQPENELSILKIEEIKINRTLVPTKGHGRRHFNLDISRHVNGRRRSTVETSVALDWRYTKEFDIHCCICVVRKLGPKELLHEIIKKPKIESNRTRDLVMESYEDAVEHGLLQNGGNLPVSMKCPIGKTQMRIPGRGLYCDHYACFDIPNFLQIYSKASNWICPVCDANLDREDLRIDGFFCTILKSAPVEGENDFQVEFDNAGNFTFSLLDIKPRKLQAETPLVEEIDLSVSLCEVQADRANGNNRTVTVVETTRIAIPISSAQEHFNDECAALQPNCLGSNVGECNDSADSEEPTEAVTNEQSAISGLSVNTSLEDVDSAETSFESSPAEEMVEIDAVSSKNTTTHAQIHYAAVDVRIPEIQNSEVISVAAVATLPSSARTANRNSGAIRETRRPVTGTIQERSVPPIDLHTANLAAKIRKFLTATGKGSSMNKILKKTDENDYALSEGEILDSTSEEDADDGDSMENKCGGSTPGDINLDHEAKAAEFAFRWMRYDVPEDEDDFTTAWMDQDISENDADDCAGCTVSSISSDDSVQEIPITEKVKVSPLPAVCEIANPNKTLANAKEQTTITEGAISTEDIGNTHVDIMQNSKNLNISTAEQIETSSEPTAAEASSSKAAPLATTATLQDVQFASSDIVANVKITPVAVSNGNSDLRSPDSNGVHPPKTPTFPPDASPLSLKLRAIIQRKRKLSSDKQFEPQSSQSVSPPAEPSAPAPKKIQFSRNVH